MKLGSRRENDARGETLVILGNDYYHVELTTNQMLS